MAVAGILSSALNAAANPKQRSEVTISTFDCLNKKTALILFAVAEAVLGENFLHKAPKFIETVDDYLNYQRPAQKEQFLFALLIAEVTIPLTVAGKFTGFSHLSLSERREILEKLRLSSQQLRRNIYAAFVNVSASTYFASELTWPDLGYAGVSVDHPEILNQSPPIPWRPTDPRPIEPYCQTIRSCLEHQMILFGQPKHLVLIRFISWIVSTCHETLVDGVFL